MTGPEWEAEVAAAPASIAFRDDRADMDSRTYLRRIEEGGGRYRIIDLAAAGRTWQIVRCADTASDDRTVYAKAPLHDAHGEGVSLDDRRRSLQVESEVFELDVAGLPDPIDRFEVASEEGSRVPVLVYDPIVGEPLYEYVAKRPREVLDLEQLLEVVREAAERIAELHERGFVLRDCDPRHLLVDDDGRFTGLAGTGNIAAIGEEPIRPSSDYVAAAYVAPEARQERSGETMRPAADVYGLAACLSYALTGEEPTISVESPLRGRAYEVLERIEPDGLARLVAAGLQPVAKRRVDAKTFRDRAAFEALPGEGEPLLEDSEPLRPLPPPWEGAEPPEANRAARSSLSPGPLISVARETETRTGDGASSNFEGVRSAPVREFVGERDEVGQSGADEAGPGKSSDAESDEPSSEETDIRREADGAPAREVSMLEENVAAGAEAQARRPDDGLPALEDLPLRTRILVGVGLPLAVMAVVIALGLLGLF